MSFAHETNRAGLRARDSQMQANARFAKDRTQTSAPLRFAAENIVNPGILLAEQDKRIERKKSHKRLFIAILLIAALIGGAYAFVSYELELWGGHVLPNVTTMGEARARQTLEDKGFVVVVQQELSDGRSDVVLAQEPEAGGRYEDGTSVTITVSTGRLVPSVVGLTTVEAKQSLSDVGASNVQVTYEESSEVAGTVIAVSPEEGSTFSSQDKITLTVATSYTVPDVVGMKEDEATKTLESIGLTAKVSYVESSEDGHTVVATSPTVGADISVGSEVTLEVSSPYPTDIHKLYEYFEHNPVDIADFLAQEDFTCTDGYVNVSGYAQALYTDGSDSIRLCSDPFSSKFEVPEENETVESTAQDGTTVTIEADLARGDVVADGASFQGVRYELAEENFPTDISGISMTSVRAIMQEFGFDNVYASCTQDTITLPKDESKLAIEDGREFLCAYGESGNLCWTILIAQVYQPVAVTTDSDEDEDEAEDLATGSDDTSAAESVEKDSDVDADADGDDESETDADTDADDAETDADTDADDAETDADTDADDAETDVDTDVEEEKVNPHPDEIRIVVTCAPTSLYDLYDLTPNGDNICDFVAYVDLYT